VVTVKGSIEDRGSSFRAVVRVDGAKRSRTFERKSEALAWLEDGAPLAPTSPAASSDSTAGLVGAETAIDTADDAVPITLAMFLDSGGYSMTNLEESSRAARDSHLRVHVRPRWGEVPLDNITLADVQAWVDELAAGTSLWTPRPSRKAPKPGDGTPLARVSADGTPKARSPKTVKEVFGTFQLVLTAAAAHGHLKSNPAKGVKLPKRRRQERRYLDAAEVRRLSEAMPPDYKLLPLLLGFAGLRIGEAFGLRWGRIDTFKCQLRVCEAVAEVNGKLIYGDTKTASGVRTIPLMSGLKLSITDHNRFTADTSPEAFVFPGRDGEPVRYRAFYSSVWQPAAERAGLAGVTPHMLRHTAVSIWIAAGCSALDAQRWAGHGSAAFTLTQYGHLFNNGADAMAKVEAFLAQDGADAA
jgi:integrase